MIRVEGERCEMDTGGLRGLRVWRRQIPQNSGGNEGEAELEKPLKETLVWSRRRRGAKTKRKKRRSMSRESWQNGSGGGKLLLWGVWSLLLRKGLLC